MKAGCKSGPMNRTTTDSPSAIIRAKCYGVFSACNAQLIPIEVVGACLVAHPITFSIPKRACFNTYNAKPCSCKPLYKHTSCRANTYNAEIYFFVGSESMHWNIDLLDRTK